jgi:hypothetical protein
MNEIVLTESFDSNNWHFSADEYGNLNLQIHYESGLEVRIYVKESAVIKLGKDFPELFFGKDWEP